METPPRYETVTSTNTTSTTTESQQLMLPQGEMSEQERPSTQTPQEVPYEEPPPSARESKMLQEITQREYEEGDAGKIEALKDLQTIFDELKDQKVIQPYDVLSPYNSTVPLPKVPPQSQIGGDGAKTPRRKVAHMEPLTPRPPAGLFFGKDPTEMASLPNLQKSSRSRPRQSPSSLQLKKDATLSLPTLAAKVSIPSQSRTGKEPKTGRKGRPQYGGKGSSVSEPRPPSHSPPPYPSTHSLTTPPSISTYDLSPSSYSPRPFSSTSQSSGVVAAQRIPPPRLPQEFLNLTEEIDLVQKDLDLVRSKEYFHQDQQEQPSTSTDPSSTARSATTTMTATAPTTTSIDDVWKADLNKLTRARSCSKAMMSALTDDGQTLQLKYKSPLWPHQQTLNQLLSRMPLLSCLILDGSELHFLRDLGSSVQSLETLSVAKCGLRSLDGTFAFPNLRTLIAKDNKIQHPIQCSFLPQLSHLDLSGNPIDQIDPFKHLRICSKLRCLKLHSTPVSKLMNFSTEMKAILPQLKELFPAAVYYKRPSTTNTHAGARKSKDTGDKNTPKGALGLDPIKPSMRVELEQAYQKLVDVNKPGIGYQQKFQPGQKLMVPPTPGGATTDDNFESVLIRTIPKRINTTEITSESYITDITELDSDVEKSRLPTTVGNRQRGSTTKTTATSKEFQQSIGEGLRGYLDTQGTTASSLFGGEESLEEIFLLRKQKTAKELDESDSEGGDGDAD